jgi:cardiolipin synthase
VEFNPIAPWRLRIGRLGRQSWEPNHRDHRKLLVCDVPLEWAEHASEAGAEPPAAATPEECAGPYAIVSITGGRNIADEYLGKSFDDGQWRDSGLIVLGPIGLQLSTLFDAMWSHAAGPPVDAPALASPVMGTAAILALGTEPGRVNLLQWAMARIAEATRKELRISCAYFIPSLRWRRALRSVARRTHACKVVIPLHNDIPVVAAASRHFLGALIRGGVEVFRYARSVLHDKTIVYDQAVTIIGSSNVDQRSFRLNYELSLVILSDELARTVARFHDQDIARSEPYTIEAWRGRPWWHRLYDWFWSLFRNQL